MSFQLPRVKLLIASFLSLAATLVNAAPVKKNEYSLLTTTTYGDILFGLGNISYFSNVQHPKATLGGDCSAAYEASSSLVPFTVILSNETVVTAAYLKSIIESYMAGDDVFTEDFLEGIYITSTTGGTPVLDASALSFLASMNTSKLFVDAAFSKYGSNITGPFSTTYVAAPSGPVLPAGPFAASISPRSIAFSTVYRLYADRFRDFLFGAYDSNAGDGSYNSFGVFLPHFWDPMIPVPSRIYSWGDERPLAGARVAIKDLYDIKGLQTSGGSQAYALVTPVANGTAPCVQQIIDIGGVLIGKFKLAQFASGANPWDWQDEHYPWNPRGDGYLTCSASSSGGGCSVAAYEWLDFAIGSDTGSSMRRPAAVSGTYGNRPSQGMIDLTRVIPLGDATDTAGVFSRDPYKWIKFAKSWYSPSLHQDPSITGLSPLVVPDNTLWPKRILYPIDYLPLANPAAEAILQNFIANLTRVFGMTVEKVNFTAAVLAPKDPITSNFTLLSSAISIIDSYHQWQVIAKPLITAWKALFDGRFPPVDPQWRNSWHSYNESAFSSSQAGHDQAIQQRAKAVDWFESDFLFSTNESCSEGLFLYDIGTGGLPSFREQDLITNNSAAAFLAVTPPGAKLSQATICPLYGCADYTIPIGQVSYMSNVTFHKEYMPVTINMVVKRGCDFMLFNMIEKLADEGVLTAVKTGSQAF